MGVPGSQGPSQGPELPAGPWIGCRWGLVLELVYIFCIRAGRTAWRCLTLGYAIFGQPDGNPGVQEGGYLILIGAMGRKRQRTLVGNMPVAIPLQAHIRSRCCMSSGTYHFVVQLSFNIRPTRLGGGLEG